MQSRCDLVLVLRGQPRKITEVHWNLGLITAMGKSLDD